MRRVLNVIINESGDFGAFQKHSPYYLVGLLLHDQRHDITAACQLLDNQIKNLGYEPHSIHTGPLIRREGAYINLTVDERKRILNALIHFCRRIDVHYTTLRVDKNDCASMAELTKILNLSLNAQLTNVSFLRVKPKEHKLFQLIDMFCSLELTSHKFTTNTASRSEVEMFYNRREFSKNYLKKIRKKRLDKI